MNEMRKIISLKYEIKCNFYFLLKFFVFIRCINILNSKYIQREIFNNVNEIRLKVNGSGSVKIINSNFNLLSKISLNGNIIEKGSTISLTAPSNDVTLSFDSPITSCYSMFYGCNQITEIDFTNFVSSEVNGIDSMFKDCTSLKSIKFGNFRTSKVSSMSEAFRNCESLEELDLSSFNTTNITHFFFIF